MSERSSRRARQTQSTVIYDENAINPHDFIWVSKTDYFCHVLIGRTAPIASGRFCKGTLAKGYPVCRKHLPAWRILRGIRDGVAPESDS